MSGVLPFDGGLKGLTHRPASPKHKNSYNAHDCGLLPPLPSITGKASTSVIPQTPDPRSFEGALSEPTVWGLLAQGHNGTGRHIVARNMFIRRVWHRRLTHPPSPRSPPPGPVFLGAALPPLLAAKVVAWCINPPPAPPLWVTEGLGLG